MTRRDDQEELDSRAREVLREIVLQYVSFGEPISSRSLAKSGRFALSPASLRNVMADLEDLGYVYQPHTSAGRVPTDRGYRFFINNLMRSRRISHQEREMIDLEVAQANEMDEVMLIGSRVLARLTDQVAVIFMPTLHHMVMRSIDFVWISDRKVLCVVVGMNGVVVNKIIETPESWTRDELGPMGRELSDKYSGMTLESIREQLAALAEQERARYDDLTRRMIHLGIEMVDEVLPRDRDIVVEGASSILSKPDFADHESVRRAFLAFQEKDKLVRILSRCAGEGGLHIVVGSESPFTHDYNLSLVAARYGSESCPVGMVGIIGPTRMEYPRVAPLVQYLGQAISRKIEESDRSNRGD
jgi:heat-inducible transcriptional repressor